MLVLFSSVALALKVPTVVTAVSRPSVVRCMSPLMEIPQERAEQANLGRIDTDRMTGSVEPSKNIAPPPVVLVQGKSLRTWSYERRQPEQVQIVLSTEGRPLEADVELWQGPGNIPTKMRVYIENGRERPFLCTIQTPRTTPNTVAIRNVGQMEFPFAASVFAEGVDTPTAECASSLMVLQGGSLRTWPFDSSVDSVQVLLTSDRMPLKARIEILQGPNNNKQVVEIYTEDGLERPFFAILETPEAGNVVRVVNTSPMEFPLRAAVVPHTINPNGSDGPVLGGNDVVIGGGDSFGSWGRGGGDGLNMY